MFNNIKYSLGTKNFKDIPFHLYDNNFTFYVNGSPFPTNRTIADALSPIIRKLHFSDETACDFSINVSCDDCFQDFLNLVYIEKKEIDANHLNNYYEYFCALGNTSEAIRIRLNLFNDINVDNIIDRLKSIIEIGNTFQYRTNDYDDSLKQLISFVAANFEEIDKSNMSSLPVETIEDILNDDSLMINDEDSLLDFILHLVESDQSYSYLFEYVNFKLVSDELFQFFINEFDLECMNRSIWKSFCSKFLPKNRNDSKKFKLRYKVNLDSIHSHGDEQMYYTAARSLSDVDFFSDASPNNSDENDDEMSLSDDNDNGNENNEEEEDINDGNENEEEEDHDDDNDNNNDDDHNDDNDNNNDDDDHDDDNDNDDNENNDNDIDNNNDDDHNDDNENNNNDIDNNNNDDDHNNDNENNDNDIDNNNDDDHNNDNDNNNNDDENGNYHNSHNDNQHYDQNDDSDDYNKNICRYNKYFDNSDTNDENDDSSNEEYKKYHTNSYMNIYNYKNNLNNNANHLISLSDVLNLEFSKFNSPPGWNITKKILNIYDIACEMCCLYSDHIPHRHLIPQVIYLNSSLMPVFDLSLPQNMNNNNRDDDDDDDDDNNNKSFDYEAENETNYSYFMSPEYLIDGKSYEINEKSEVYNFSTLIFYYFTGKCPFKEKSLVQMVDMVNKGFREQIPPEIPTFIQQMITHCWSKSPEHRPTFNEIVQIIENNDDYDERVNINEIEDYIFGI